MLRRIRFFIRKENISEGQRAQFKETEENHSLKIPVGTYLSNLPKIFEDVKNFIRAKIDVNREKYDPDNIKVLPRLELEW